MAWGGVVVGLLTAGCAHVERTDACHDGRVSSSSALGMASSSASVHVDGFDGVACATLQRPLVAVNFSSPPADAAQRDDVDAYNRGVLRYLSAVDTKLLFVSEANGVVLRHEGALLQPARRLALPLYASAGAFVSMVSHPGFQTLGAKKGSATFAAYSFVFETCVVGCEQALMLPPSTSTPAVVVHLDVDGVDDAFAVQARERTAAALRAAVSAFAAEGFDVAFAGVAVARPRFQAEDGTNRFPYANHGIDATVLLTPRDDVDLASITTTAAYSSLTSLADGVVVVAFADD